MTSPPTTSIFFSLSPPPSPLSGGRHVKEHLVCCLPQEVGLHFQYLLHDAEQEECHIVNELALMYLCHASLCLFLPTLSFSFLLHCHEFIFVFCVFVVIRGLFFVSLGCRAGSTGTPEVEPLG